MDDLLAAVRAFKRRLDGMIGTTEDRPQERKSAPRTSDRFTNLPDHPFRALDDAPEEYRFPGLPQLCPTSGTVDVVLSGIAECGCHGTTKVDGVTLNGSYTLSWNGSYFELTGQGAYTFHVYSDGCITETSSSSGTWTITASCSGGVWSVGASPSADFVDGGFSTLTAVAPGVSIPNNFTCAGGSYVGDGNATLTL